MKDLAIEVALEEIGRLLFKRSRTGAGLSQTCISCGGDANSFRDEISKAEYRISRLCQKCQDEIWGAKTRG
jgi:hypothetical protein